MRAYPPRIWWVNSTVAGGLPTDRFGHERTMMWTAFANRLEQLLEDFRPAGEVERDQYATIAMDYQALRLMGSAALGQAARGERDIPAVSVLKLFGSEAEQSAFRHALEAAGVEGLAEPTTTPV